MSELTFQQNGNTFTASDGRAVEVVLVNDKALRTTMWRERPCYAVRTRGDHDLYFGSSTILATFDLPSGVRETIYIPGDSHFPGWASNMVRLDAWPSD